MLAEVASMPDRGETNNTPILLRHVSWVKDDIAQQFSQ